MRTIRLKSAQQRKLNRLCWTYATRILRQWIRQVARRPRPHKALFSTTQTLTKQSHVDPNPFLRRQSRRHCLLMQAFTVSHQQCVEILSRYFLSQGQEPHGRVVTFHSRQNFGCRRRTTHALDCSIFPKDPRGHRVSSLVCQTSDSTTLILPVVQIAEKTVMKHR
jgi:hypothetical protein